MAAMEVRPPGGAKLRRKGDKGAAEPRTEESRGVTSDAGVWSGCLPGGIGSAAGSNHSSLGRFDSAGLRHSEILLDDLSGKRTEIVWKYRTPQPVLPGILGVAISLHPV
jgi:hypothetical protein